MAHRRPRPPARVGGVNQGRCHGNKEGWDLRQAGDLLIGWRNDGRFGWAPGIPTEQLGAVRCTRKVPCRRRRVRGAELAAGACERHRQKGTAVTATTRAAQEGAG